MLVDVLLEFLVGFLKGGSLDPADVALVLLVGVDLGSLGTKLSEGVDDDSTDDVLEEETEEHEVDQVVGETERGKFLHAPVDGSRDVDVDQALDHGVALLLLLCVEVGAVYPVGDDTEGVDEHDTEKGDVEELVELGDDGVEHILEEFDPGEDEDEVEREVLGLVEGAHQGDHCEDDHHHELLEVELEEDVDDVEGLVDVLHLAEVGDWEGEDLVEPLEDLLHPHTFAHILIVLLLLPHLPLECLRVDVPPYVENCEEGLEEGEDGDGAVVGGCVDDGLVLDDDVGGEHPYDGDQHRDEETAVEQELGLLGAVGES